MTKRIVFLSVFVVGALAVAAAFGAVAYNSAKASAEPVAGEVFQLTRPFLGHGGVDEFGRGPGDGETGEDLAAALGISVEELQSAVEEAKVAAIDQALAEGLITQAQADDLKANGAAFPLGRNWKGWLSENGIDFQALLADELGISVEELEAARTTAFNTRIDQAVADGKLTEEQADLIKGQRALVTDEKFQASMQAAFESAVNQAVSDGVITQAQAEQILANREAKGGLGGFGGRHGGRGPGIFGGPEEFEKP